MIKWCAIKPMECPKGGQGCHGDKCLLQGQSGKSNNLDKVIKMLEQKK